MGDAGDIAGKPTGDARRFAAFISYSHADAAAAAKLQRKLERYRLPKRIAETRTSEATALGSIFRDREDLAAAASLSEAIREAIARADALVVMCSPDAAASPWVAAEIELFRKLHPQKPILAAILSGEPAIAFPPALTVNGNEPLAADLRAEGDGAQLGFLKIVAGIAGAPLDSLIQRDAQRRIRRVTAITGGALAAMLIMGIMTAFAIQARNEAAQQRAAAEGLVEYMLTDLREKLKGVGRLDVMDGVNERAMQHYRRQGNLETLTADGLERRARILHAMGEDYDQRGKLDAAHAKFAEAHRTTDALLSKAPKNPHRVFAHAQSEYWLGYVGWQRNSRPMFTRHWNRYLDLSLLLARLERNGHRALLEVGYAYGNLCDLNLRDAHNLRLASLECQKSIQYERRAMTAAPGDTKIATALANRFGWLAQVQEMTGNLNQAHASRREERELIEKLLKRDPENLDLRMRMIWSILGSAKLFDMQSDFDKAISEYQSGIVAINRLASQSDPTSTVLQTQMKLLAGSALSRKASGDPRWRIDLEAAKRTLAAFDPENEGYEYKNRMKIYLNQIEQGDIL